MNTAVAWILGIATVLGGIAALWFFRDKWRERDRFTDEDKEVNSAWWEASALRKDYEARGFTAFRWSNSDKVTQRIAEGTEVIYEIDRKRKVRYRLVNNSKQVLLGRKGTKPAGR